MEAVLECPYAVPPALEEVVFADMRHTFHLLENEPRVLELAQVVVRNAHNSRSRACAANAAYFSAFCAMAHRPASLSRQYHPRYHCRAFGTLKYRYTQLFTNQTLEELERELCFVLTLLVRG